ncbi:hypothetical protein N9Q58_01345 [Polaribacter sp.]|nr:hypothetical protein [Polaribacter sp.]
MEEPIFKVVSNHKNLRLCIIENCIFIEETISKVLGKVLNIDWKESKSFGFSSSALGFNQKVYLIMDIKGLKSKELKKLTTLMNIRNKFAHLSGIKTFDDLFSKTKIGKEVKNNFHTWYFDEKGLSDIPKKNHEKILRYCFYLLVHNISEILLKIVGDHMYELGMSDGKKEYIKRLNFEILESLNKNDGGKKIIKDVLNKIENDITPS